MSSISAMNVPDVYQFYNYSSGHACLSGVFAYYQFPTSAVRYREESLMQHEDFDKDNFTSP